MNGYQAEIGLRDYTLQLEANKVQRIRTAGDYIVFVEASAKVNIRTDNRAEITRTAPAGTPVDYQGIEVWSAVDQVVTLSLGFVGDKPPAMGGGSGGGGPITVNPSVGTAIRNLGEINCVGNARTQLIGSDLTRFECIVVVPDNLTGVGYLGNASVDASNGLPVDAGDRVVLQSRAPLYFFNAGATAVSVRVIESLA